MKKQPKAAAIDTLEELYRKKQRKAHPNVPISALPRKKFRDDSANALTDCVITYITLTGGWATRVQSQGQYNPTLGRWTKGQTKLGTPDIMGTLADGRFIAVEVKYGKDKLSEDQREVGKAIQGANAIWLIAESFEQFYQAVEVCLNVRDIPF